MRRPLLSVLLIGTVLLVAAWLVLRQLADRLHFGNATPLHRAIMKRDVEHASRLIARGDDVNAKMHAPLQPATWGATPLHLAARRDLPELIDPLLKSGADIQALDDARLTPLHAALEEGANESALRLIAAGGYAPETDAAPAERAIMLEHCTRPLGSAFARASVAAVLALIAAGADIDRDVGPNATALADSPDLRAKLELLASRGFDLDAATPRGSALHTAAIADDVDAILFLVDQGADIEARDAEFCTPLLLAALRGSNSALLALLKHGANPIASAPNYGSILYAAAFEGNTHTVRQILEMNLGIDLQAGRASDRATPLHFAYWHENTEMISLLLNAGANPEARTTDGRRPIEFRK